MLNSLFIEEKGKRQHNTFDNVGREQLWKILEERGIEKTLIGRLKKVHEETKTMIRTEKGLSNIFEIRKRYGRNRNRKY